MLHDNLHGEQMSNKVKLLTILLYHHIFRMIMSLKCSFKVEFELETTQVETLYRKRSHLQLHNRGSATVRSRLFILYPKRVCSFILKRTHVDVDLPMRNTLWLGERLPSPCFALFLFSDEADTIVFHLSPSIRRTTSTGRTCFLLFLLSSSTKFSVFTDPKFPEESVL